jgi:hypothetical protein
VESGSFEDDAGRIYAPAECAAASLVHLQRLLGDSLPHLKLGVT